MESDAREQNSDPGAAAGRPHTGRRRNEAVRRAVLDRALELLADAGGAPITIDAVARAAGVGKQTIYRWWPSKGAVLLDALFQRSGEDVPPPDTGSVHTDLLAVVDATFAAAQRGFGQRPLRTLVREAGRDPHLAELLRTYTAARRQAVRDILVRGVERGELAPGTDVGLVVDQFYGLFWYRFLLGHAPLDRETATRLTESVLCRWGPGG
jgi:AcrR family transcriptional regulator